MQPTTRQPAAPPAIQEERNIHLNRILRLPPPRQRPRTPRFMLHKRMILSLTRSLTSPFTLRRVPLLVARPRCGFL